MLQDLFIVVRKGSLGYWTNTWWAIANEETLSLPVLNANKQTSEDIRRLTSETQVIESLTREYQSWRFTSFAKSFKPSLKFQLFFFSFLSRVLRAFKSQKIHNEAKAKAQTSLECIVRFKKQFKI